MELALKASVSQGIMRISHQQLTTESKKGIASSPLDPLSSICKPLVIKELDTVSHDTYKKKLLSQQKDSKNMTVDEILDLVTLCEKLIDINKQDIEVLKSNIFNLKTETVYLSDLQAELEAVQIERRFALDKQRMAHYSTIENTMKNLQTLKDELQKVQTQIRRFQEDMKEKQGDNSSRADNVTPHSSFLKMTPCAGSSSCCKSKQCCSHEVGKGARNEGGREGPCSSIEAAGDTKAIKGDCL